MNNVILLVEENADDRFLIERALHKRFLNQTNLVAQWSKPIQKTVNCNSSRLNPLEVSYPPTPPVDKRTELVVSVKSVENREETVNYLKGNRPYANRECYPLPALILIGVAMPHLAGLSLLAWIKRQPELMHVPIVVISDVDKKDQAINLGAYAYIFKTLCFTVLTEVVRVLLLSKSMNSQEESQSNKRHSKQLRTLENPLTKSSIAQTKSTGTVIQTASWRRTGWKTRKTLS